MLDKLGILAQHRRLSALSQTLHYLANSVATCEREVVTRDLSGEIFKVANEALNLRMNEPAVREAIKQLGMEAAPDFFLRGFREPETTAANTQILQSLLHLSGAEAVLMGQWAAAALERDILLSQLSPYLHVGRVKMSDSLLMSTHLAYKGRV